MELVKVGGKSVRRPHRGVSLYMLANILVSGLFRASNLHNQTRGGSYHVPNIVNIQLLAASSSGRVHLHRYPYFQHPFQERNCP